MKKLVVLALAVFLAATPTWADTFINGGFESGDFTGWVKNGGYFYGGSNYQYIGDPGKSAIVTPGYDPLTNNQLPTVAYGNYAARVNNYDWNYHFSTLSQRVNNYTDNYIYFAWAAVLEEPPNYHGPANAPNFSIILRDLTTNTEVYNVTFNVYQPPPGINWRRGATGPPNDYGSTWYFTEWVIQQIDATPYYGHDLELFVLASDCGWGGHGGYAYVDGFGGTPPPPPPPPVVPVPGTVLLLASGLLGLWGVRRLS